MSRFRTIITMRIPVSRYRHVTVEFDSSEPLDFCAIPFSEWRTNGAQVCAVIRKRTKENGASAPLLHSLAETAHERRKSSPKGAFQAELEQALEALSSRSSLLAKLDDELAPVWAEEDELKSDILATYNYGKNVLVLNPDGAGDRAPLFARRLAISERWGKIKEQRRDVHRHVRSLEKDITRLRKLIEAEKKGASNGKRASV